jgi:hypothetical protein
VFTQLADWEFARIEKLIQDEIDDRHRYPGRVGKPIGDPMDITVYQKVLTILRATVKETK